MVRRMYFLGVSQAHVGALCAQRMLQLRQQQTTQQVQIIALHLEAPVTYLPPVPNSRGGAGIRLVGTRTPISVSPLRSAEAPAPGLSPVPPALPCPQPLQLREPLHSLLLTMCEDQPSRRLPLPAVLEACRLHQDDAAIYPASANLHVRRLVSVVLGSGSEVSVDPCCPTQEPWETVDLAKL